MRTANLLFSAAHFLVVLTTLALGGFFLSLPYTESFRYNLTYYLYHRPEFFTLTGSMMMSFGLLLLFGLYRVNRRRFLTIETRPMTTLVDEGIIHNWIQQYWREKYPKKEACIDVVVQKGKVLQIFLPIPENWEGEREELLISLQNDLAKRLFYLLGYHREFYITLYD